MNTAIAGANFRDAPVELRERIAYAAADMPAALERLAAALDGSEVVLLSTCNRTELYVAGPAADWDRERLVRALLDDCGLRGDEWQKHFYFRHGRDAVEHLLTVAASLDSMVVGETEIFGQLKQAYAAACEVGTAGRVLHPLMHQVFRAVKRIRTETAITAGRVSVASIAVDLAAKVFESLATKTVMIIGAGEISEETMRNLVGKGVHETLVLNRSLRNGQALAARYGGTAVPLARLPDYLSRADIVISSTAAPHPVVLASVVRQAVAQRHGLPMLLIDLAVPRDIERAVDDIGNVYLYNIDDLKKVAEDNRARRQAAADVARRLIAREAAGIGGCRCADELADIMRRLDGLTQDIREAELDRAFGKRAVAIDEETCSACREEIRVMMHRTVKKFLAPPRKALNRAARDGEWDEYARIVRDLFEIEAKEADDKN